MKWKSAPKGMNMRCPSTVSVSHLYAKTRKGFRICGLRRRTGETSPRQLDSDDNEDSPSFPPNGDLVFRASRGGINYLFTRKQDGSGEKRLLDQPILGLSAVSPSGKWAM